MTTKIDPEKTFTDVPENFSSESQLTAVTISNNSAGIIFDSLADVEFALRVYNGEAKVAAPTSSHANQNEFLDNLDQQGGGIGVAFGLLAIDKQRQGRDFVGSIMAEAKSTLAGHSIYCRDFDYDGMGSNFMKTTVKIKALKGKFVLGLNAACVGNKPELDLAKLLQRPLAIASVWIELSMSVVDDYWYNTNLRDVFAAPVTFVEAKNTEFWERLAEILAMRDDSHYNSTPWKYGFTFRQRIGIKHPLHRRDGTIVAMAKARGLNLTGSSWNVYSNEHEPEEQKLYLLFSLDGDYEKGYAVDQDERAALELLTQETAVLLLKQVK